MVRRTSALLAALMIVLLVAPSAAFAQTALPAYSVQAWVGGDPSTPGQVLLIAGVTLPTSTPLPAKVRIPLPEGMAVTWAGEIIGPDGSGDISRTGTITAGTGGKVYEFTLEKSHDAQIEGPWVGLDPDGDRLKTTMKWIQSVPAEIVSFSVRTPPGAQEIRIDPASNTAPQENDAGERLYTLPSKPLKAGEAHTIELSYLPAGVGGSAPAGGGNTLIAVLGGIVVALVVVIAVLVRRERAATVE